MKPAPPRRIFRGNEDYEFLFRRAQDVLIFSMPNDAETEVLALLMKKAVQSNNPIMLETMAVIAEAIVYNRVNRKSVGML